MLLTIYFIVLIGLVLAELTKGLSANGTPPFLQKLPGQMHLAHFMWSNIMLIRIVLIIASSSPESRRRSLPRQRKTTSTLNCRSLALTTVVSRRRSRST